jgi:hypothetical protein
LKALALEGPMPAYSAKRGDCPGTEVCALQSLIERMGRKAGDVVVEK